jgi:hypothetical protein
VQQASFLWKVPLSVNLARLASTILILENKSVKVVQQASIWQLREQHKVQYVETVQQARFQQLQEQAAL